MTIKFEEYDDEMYDLKWCLPCRKNNHHDSEGRNVRLYSPSGKRRGCLACAKQLPPGLFTHLFKTVTETAPTNQKYTTDEEKRAARVRAQMAWNARNKDKTKVYAERYNSKPETQEKYRKSALERYHNNEKFNEKRKQYMMDYYYRKKAEKEAAINKEQE